MKDQIFLSTEKYEIVQHDKQFEICRGECLVNRTRQAASKSRSLKWPRNPFNQIQTFHKLNAPSEFIHSSKMKVYSFRIIQSCLNIHKVSRIKWVASSRWPDLYRFMLNSDQMIIGKTHPTFLETNDI